MLMTILSVIVCIVLIIWFAEFLLLGAALLTAGIAWQSGALIGQILAVAIVAVLIMIKAS